MGAATIEAIAAGRSVLASVTGDRFAVGRQLLAAVGVLAGSAALRSALADQAADEAAKAKVVDAVFASAAPGTKAVLRSVAASRWSSQDDLLRGVEEFGIRAVAGSAPAGVSITDELSGFGKAARANAELEYAVGSTLVAGDEKAEVVEQLLEGKASAQTVAILAELVAQSRGRRIGELVALAADLVADESGRTLATVHTATPLTVEQSTRLAATLAKTAGRDVTIDEIVDPSLIGGLRVVIDGNVIDGTVASKLAALRLALVGQTA